MYSCCPTGTPTTYLHLVLYLSAHLPRSKFLGVGLSYHGARRPAIRGRSPQTASFPWLLACLLACLLTYLFTYLLTYLLACLLIYSLIAPPALVKVVRVVLKRHVRRSSANDGPAPLQHWYARFVALWGGCTGGPTIRDPRAIRAVCLLACLLPYLLTYLLNYLI